MKSDFLSNVREAEAVKSTQYPKIVPFPAERLGRRVNELPGILFLTSYPPRECGIATYSQDLIRAMNNKFNNSFSIQVCALESGVTDFAYPDEVKFVLDTNDSAQYLELAAKINADRSIKFVMVQHEFGLFQQADDEDTFLEFLHTLTKPAVLVFHTVLPQPSALLKRKVLHLVAACASVIVMTKNAAKILVNDYCVPHLKVNVIAHGTHLVPHLDKEGLKAKYGLANKKVLSTFGLLSSGKSIETTLDSLPEIVKSNPDVVFLVIGKTHPGVVKSEGEKYRKMLEAKVEELSLQPNVKFVNRYLSLNDLLEYLQTTDIYLFTSKDQNQAVSGTFSYAMSCGCPIISTPIPHAVELLHENTGIIVDFQNPQQLAAAVNRLLADESLRWEFSANALQSIVPTSWENSAIAHAQLLQQIAENTPSELPQTGHQGKNLSLRYRTPAINLAHFQKMTTEVGMIQFAKINQPDPTSGYTLDDNARALIAMLMHYELTHEEADLQLIRTYVAFIKLCQQPEGHFLNYVDSEKRFAGQNNETNLSDSNGRALWALGYLISKSALLPADLVATVRAIIKLALPAAAEMHSTRAMAFTIKGLYYCNLEKKSAQNSMLIKTLANRLLQMYRHEAEAGWEWYESYLTYANSLLPEAMLCAWQDTGEPAFRTTAKASFDFLLTHIFNEGSIKVISNNGWLQKGQERQQGGGEQPIDIAYTILALRRFYQAFREEAYSHKMTTAFNWFLGNNHLHQIIYNPCTGGCFDGLEEHNVNLNQGAESTVSYLLSRLTMEKHLHIHPSLKHDN